VGRETEAKIALQPGEMDRVRDRLIHLGAESRGIDDEENIIFRCKRGDRRGDRRRLRLRTFGGRSDALLTCKGPTEKGAMFKSRDEIEVQVSNAESVRELLHNLGFRPKTAYHKRREHWFLAGTMVALDQLAFGDFLEVEGAETAIHTALALLGLDRRNHVRSGYARLSRALSDNHSPRLHLALVSAAGSERR
jgi:predicted adenylyl cyclase CyaB